MSFEVRITQAAWADAQRVFEWIRDEKHAPLTAERWFNGWLKRLRSLETFPEGRSSAPENVLVSGLELHQQLFGFFRTLYVVGESVVFIVHLRRASRRTATLEELEPGIDEATEQEA